jgi:hypothetical protein
MKEDASHENSFTESLKAKKIDLKTDNKKD